MISIDPNHLKKVKFVNKTAKFMVSGSGILVVACLITMVVLMIRVTLPLFQSPDMESHDIPLPSNFLAEDAAAMGLGPYLENAWILDKDGNVHHCELETLTWHVLPKFEKVTSVFQNGHEYTVQLEHGGIQSFKPKFEPVFDDHGERTIEFSLDIHPVLQTDAAQKSVQVSGNTGVTTVQLANDGSLLVRKVSEEEDLFGEVTVQENEWPLDVSNIRDFTLSKAGNFMVATSGLHMQYWSLASEPQLLDQTPHRLADEIKRLAFTFGDQSVIASHQSGLISVWFMVDGKLTRIHEFESAKSASNLLIPSGRDKSFWAVRNRSAQLMHMTTGRKLINFVAHEPLHLFGVNETLSGALSLDKSHNLQLHQIYAPHGDVSLGTLWSQIWYEGYPQPEYVWQSSSASDDAEPKLSLVPLLFGSLKGTFYSLLFALPLAFGAAFYVSYLMEPKLKKYIKPILELMAAIPSVVIGFIAALWLAPRIEGIIPAVFLTMVALPLIFIGSSMLVKPFEKFIPSTIGYEFLLVIPFVIIGCFLTFQLGTWVEATFLDGNFKLWFFEEFNGHFDQRNCLVVGMALGFTVFPLVFTISEDALSNVPKSMTAASLALGASRWQTLRKVVLPMASPGLFAASMIGLGRAVGETMIVLMATGNTPILDPSIFNGMRTLAANIAVEIPEAPVDGSLYRVLFLSGLLLFALTFLINSIAEGVRARLKKKYAHF